jgi:hypothetical protein
MKGWKAEWNSVSQHQQLNIFSLMENITAVIQLERKDPQIDSPTVPKISMPLKIPLSFTTSKYGPNFNGMRHTSFQELSRLFFHLSDCVSVLSFLLTILAEEEAKSSPQPNKDSSSNGAENSSNLK